METVLVTGGLGKSGRWLVDSLAESHDVVCADFSHPGFDTQGTKGIEFRALDLTERGAVFDLVTDLDPDAVVHWGAIPVAGRHPGGDVFENNTLAAYNVLAAAGRVDARVVQASSDGAYGFYGAAETPVPDELPITEEHTLRPEDDYGLSKVAAEEIAKSVVRRDGVPVASVRPSWIQYPGEYPCRDDGYLSDLAAGAGNYWSYVDIRDVVGLVEAALEGTKDGRIEGHEAFNCVGPDNALGESLADLVAEFYGSLPADCSVEGDASAYSVAKAEDVLGWAPEHSWRESVDEAVDDPELTG
ncbi:NAD-dependent epimerase/dehydratase family protein [Halogranum rubrum]|uniref:UDP-glucose 4-epimerase n=1 Tax=Halogranum salarium B-1 TaxID=1210908 RepID=J3JG53_9EURY|nr:NAD(P)-dependent oxidoreductase [Halogranum salarium]EJN59834.1 UDP-glucose 4-epimerase [Halogranum salarium B-1]